MLNAASMQRLSRKTLFDSSSHIYFVEGSCFICYFYQFIFTGVQHDFNFR